MYKIMHTVDSFSFVTGCFWHAGVILKKSLSGILSIIVIILSNNYIIDKCIVSHVYMYNLVGNILDDKAFCIYDLYRKLE